jgi:hypothetical protein
MVFEGDLGQSGKMASVDPTEARKDAGHAHTLGGTELARAKPQEPTWRGLTAWVRPVGSIRSRYLEVASLPTDNSAADRAMSAAAMPAKFGTIQGFSIFPVHRGEFVQVIG